MAWKYQDNSRGNQTLGQVAINLVPKHLRDKISIFRAKRSEEKFHYLFSSSNMYRKHMTV